MNFTMPDLSGIIVLALIYLAFRAGEWNERHRWDKDRESN